ncbi:glycerol-3-phosphate dehydrogenase/oxidase (plasmid) [Deinococcus metallilatus]|uniref:Glycerol-3-phosphate dehydrogenase n=1 Tax=Deinococcus metallilatus TaxID=1211322 RepID=A0AAJ5F7M8_9DEIO|nr:glycerol-3-phosphate dehydrogenase/oxidase [Deinococcus metallilatus]MBB5293232.1 glycerol-3-phosphate dehydrogenase [Deinococcus metallilatus]QBY07019.1 glycerol-3-phosphate dehydrogenase/oxidase [Deinococcus metallilatus]RXJ18030.1 glycerol-3-phosphate dehydrogenase/oxidase [Deinococcus metallilatus]TLK31966.1 glycerol-3-phosphate dehydrogenase/oxidase [Deinococcus metallilatus]GMA15544.1 glycerol-3-phosphate dehydrogenase [Deinococcus metallilatus]
MPQDPRSAILAAATAPGIWDVLVIGGGASGLGTAVEAATRGHRTLLLEAQDYAKGTSSRSTKLVHGGVRYLAQGNVGLVREALHERGLLRKNAPHLVRDLGFVVPAYNWWAGPFYGIGLKLYDILAGKLNLGSSKYLGKEAALERAPTLQPEGLMGGILYYDGQFDDARLAVTLLRTLEDHGGVALNYAPVTGLLKEDGKVVGVRFRDLETGREYEVRARAIVNATGVWVDDIRRMENADAKPMLSPSQGTHIVVDRRFLPGDSAIMIPRTDDGRVLFAVPWHDHVVIGTTDTPVSGTSFEPRPLEEEIDFILNTAGRYMNPAPTRADVLSTYAGLRPLVKPADNADTKEISRDHVIRVSEGGLITLTGGKWTTYRRMGEDTVNRAERVAGLPERLTVTPGLHLHGWSEEPRPDPLRVYGSDAERVEALPGADRQLHPELPYTEAELRWGVRHESARTVEDLLARRTRALLLNARASSEAAPRAAAILAEELGQDAAWAEAQAQAYQNLAQGYQL